MTIFRNDFSFEMKKATPTFSSDFQCEIDYYTFLEWPNGKFNLSRCSIESKNVTKAV